MSALGKLIGVECAECRRKDLRLATMSFAPVEIAGEDGAAALIDEPMCLRCANGEPCCYVTAERRAPIERMAEEVDLFVLPPMSRDERQAVRDEATAFVRDLDARRGEIRKLVLKDAETMTAREIAAKYNVSVNSVSGWMGRAARTRAQQALSDAAVIVEENLRRRRRVIGGEVVHIAPKAVMGAEMLLDKKPPHYRLLKRRCDGCGIWFEKEVLILHRLTCVYKTA